jgi:NitT/TauT family transport system substrate-binding protein
MTETASFRPSRARATLRGTVFIAALTALATVPGIRIAHAAATHLTISYSEKVGDELSLWIADDGGYFKKEGLDVTVRYIPSREGIPALLTNQVQIASIGGPDALSAEAAGTKLKFFATLSPVLTFQLWAQPAHATKAGLEGQRIGVPSTTGSMYGATVLALEKLGLPLHDVAITSLGSVPNVDSALIAGSIAAAASHPPATYEFQKHGDVKMVDLAKERIPSINTGLLATDAYIKANPEICQKVTDALVEALHREKTDQAFTEKEMEKYMHVKEKAVADFTYDFYAKEIAPSIPMPEAKQLEPAKKALSLTNAKMKNVDLAAMIDQQFVKTAVASKK